MENIFPVCPLPATLWKIKSNLRIIKKIPLSFNAVHFPTIVQACIHLQGSSEKKF